jgi:hypothetical protein
MFPSVQSSFDFGDILPALIMLSASDILEAYQAGYWWFSEEKPLCREGAQEYHTALCLVAYIIVERERLDQGDTWHQHKRQLIWTGPQGALAALRRVRAVV